MPVRFTVKLSQAERQGIESAKRLIQSKIVELGPESPGWAVDILVHSLTHLLLKTALPHEIPPNFIDDWSAVEKWASGEIRTRDTFHIIH